ncbi:uncharacterized protein LOC124280356 [Haliotis rubra]|uniref:uncharacterized protein LOC124280356 n=1 Tax=Haliotis rubra TaxID=36100 RepID=UPI001EE5A7ED|nr:uncharacterized protein LOC124280356 [Haliotis rubra]
MGVAICKQRVHHLDTVPQRPKHHLRPSYFSSGMSIYRASTLVHTVSYLDSGRQFRCSVLSADYSANKTVYVLATGASLTASPSQITIGGRNPTSQLTVGCRPNAPGITTVYGMEIGKKSSTGTDHTIIRMTNTDSSVQVVDTGLQQRMTASGSISGATGNIQFILTDLRCADAASTYYYCKTSHLVGTDGNDEATINITAGRDCTIEECTGRIGNQFDENNLQNLWTWEWRSVNSEFTTWTRYPNDQNITYDRPTSVAECQYTGRQHWFTQSRI